MSEISRFRAMILLGELQQHENAAKLAGSQGTRDAHLNRAQAIRDALTDDGWEIVSTAYTVRRAPAADELEAP